MLVLTRRVGEKIVIGNDVVVTVLEVRSDQVRIGIDAPRSVQVHREEVHAQIASANTAAVAAAAQTRALLRHRPPRPPSLRAKDTPPSDPDTPPRS